MKEETRNKDREEISRQRKKKTGDTERGVGEKDKASFFSPTQIADGEKNSCRRCCCSRPRRPASCRPRTKTSATKKLDRNKTEINHPIFFSLRRLNENYIPLRSFSLAAITNLVPMTQIFTKLFLNMDSFLKQKDNTKQNYHLILL